MKTAKEVLSALNVIKPTPKQKEHAKTLSDIYTMLKEIAGNVISVERKEQTFFFGRAFDLYRNSYYGEVQKKSDLRTIIDGLEMKGEQWTIKTPSGCYSISLPIDNPLYYAFCNLFPSLIQVNQAATVTPDRILIFDKVIASEIKKAMKFIKYDSLRVAMNCVHVKVNGGYVEIMGTNGTKLYRSGYLYFDDHQKDGIYLFPLQTLQAAKIGDSLTVGLYYDRDTITKGTINGVEFQYPDESPLQYENVIPTYYDFVQFDRKELIQVVKSVLPTANKVTHAIKFYFNGCIEVSAEDLDFSYENDVRINYSKKTVKDFKIALNGKLLLDCLNAIDENLVRLYSNGEANKCILINDKALLMPVVFIDNGVEKSAAELARELNEARKEVREQSI